MIEDKLKAILEDARQQMDKSLDHLRVELTHIRAGRATPVMLEDIRVDAYGSSMPLNQVASVGAPQPDLLVVQPWDRTMLGAIEKAIQQANLGFNPANDGNIIRIPVPTLTEERRRELAKGARGRGEESKISIRNIRRSSRDELKKAKDSENLSEDMLYESEDRLQKMTDDYVGRIDKMLDKKEAEIMAV